MEKLIIDNRTDLPMTTVLDIVESVVAMGRISNNETSYCYSSTWGITGHPEHEQVDVSAFQNDKSDRLVVHYNDGIDHKAD